MKPERRLSAKFPTLLFILGGLLLFGAMGLLLVNPSSGQAVKPVQVGQPMNDFSLIDLSGETVWLSDYAGRVVLINAWATWCPPCVAEMPDLQAFYQQHQDEGFVILGINAGDAPETAAAFVRQKGITFPILLDPKVDFLSRLGVNSYPTTILVDADGMVKTIHVGMYMLEDLEAEIAPYLR